MQTTWWWIWLNNAQGKLILSTRGYRNPKYYLLRLTCSHRTLKHYCWLRYSSNFILKKEFRCSWLNRSKCIIPQCKKKKAAKKHDRWWCTVRRFRVIKTKRNIVPHLSYNCICLIVVKYSSFYCIVLYYRSSNVQLTIQLKFSPPHKHVTKCFSGLHVYVAW